MINLKDEFSILKPKYVDNSRFIYCMKDSIKYIVNRNLCAIKTINTEVTEPFILRVPDLNDYLVLDKRMYNFNDSIYKDLDFRNLTFDEFNISEEFFNILNTIVSMGISPLNIGYIKIINGILKLTYYSLEYCILANIEIENKSLVSEFYIDYDYLYYLYSFYKEFKEKKKDLNVKICAGNINTITNCNNVYLISTNANINTLFYESLCTNMKELFETYSQSKSDVFNKKSYIDTIDASSKSKNLLKCMSDEFNVLNVQDKKFKIIFTEKVSIVVGV